MYTMCEMGAQAMFRREGRLTRLFNFSCWRCRSIVIEEEYNDATILLWNDNNLVVSEFSYLGNTISTEGDVDAAVTARIGLG